MKQYSIVYENPPRCKGTSKFLSKTNPIVFSTLPSDAMIFSCISEASMLLELLEYQKCDEDHCVGKVMERVEKIVFRDIR